MKSYFDTGVQSADKSIEEFMLPKGGKFKLVNTIGSSLINLLLINKPQFGLSI